MTSASCETTARSSTASSARRATASWSRRCAASCAACPSRAEPASAISSRTRLAAVAALLIAAPACTNFGYDGFLAEPIPLTVSEDTALLDVILPDGRPSKALVSTNSPISVVNVKADTVDIGDDGELLRGLSRKRLDQLRLQDANAPKVTRFVLRNFTAFDLPLGSVGQSHPVKVGAMLGLGVLRHFAISLRYRPTPALVLRDVIGDRDRELARDCDPDGLLQGKQERCVAVMSTPLRGGGIMLFRNQRLTMRSSRIVLPVCAVPAAFDPSARPARAPIRTGTPLSGLLATDQGVSLLARSAFERLRAAHSGVKLLARAERLHLPSGPVTAAMADVPALAIVGDRTTQLGPCGELARRRRRLVASLLPSLPRADINGDGAAAVVLQTALRFAVVPDDSPVFAGVRRELGAQVPVVDALIGGSVLRYLELDVDYRRGRTIFRCASDVESDTCQALPRCRANTSPQCPRPSS